MSFKDVFRTINRTCVLHFVPRIGGTSPFRDHLAVFTHFYIIETRNHSFFLHSTPATMKSIMFVVAFHSSITNSCYAAPGFYTGWCNMDSARVGYRGHFVDIPPSDLKQWSIQSVGNCSLLIFLKKSLVTRQFLYST